MTTIEKAKKLFTVLPADDYMRAVCQTVIDGRDAHNGELFVERTYRFYFGRKGEQ